MEEGWLPKKAEAMKQPCHRKRGRPQQIERDKSWGGAAINELVSPFHKGSDEEVQGINNECIYVCIYVCALSHFRFIS